MTRSIATSSLPHRLLLFLLFPFLAFVKSVRHIHIREHFLIVLFFALFFSYTFLPIPNSDATRYEERLSSLGDYSMSEYLSDIQGMYDGSGLYEDAYIYTIQLLVSPISDDIRVYRLVFGLIYFFVFLTLLKSLVLNQSKKNYGFNWFMLGVVFLISFTAGINGVRWPLALMIFLLGSYKYISNGKLKFVLLASLSVLIHFTFFFSVLFLLLYIVTKRFYNPKITSLIVLGTFILSTFLVSGIKGNIGLIGTGIEEKAIGFSENEQYKDSRLEGYERLNWYVQAQRTAPNIFVLVALIITTYFGFRLTKSKLTKQLQYFALLMFIASFLSAQIVDHTSNRFTIIALAAGLIYLYHLYNENSGERIMQILKNSYIPIVILTILVILRADLYTVSPNLLIGNLFFELFIDFDESIQDILFGN